jgi:hypothetical protein
MDKMHKPDGRSSGVYLSDIPFISRSWQQTGCRSRYPALHIGSFDAEILHAAK